MASTIISNKSTKADILKWAQESNNVEWLKAKAAEKVEKKVYPKVYIDGKYVEDKTVAPQIVMQDMTFLGIKKAIMKEFFTSASKKAKKKTSILDDIAKL